MDADASARRPRGETRQRVLETAERLFLEHGYAGTSIRDIAQELQLTKAAVHYHFAAKEQLMAALLEPVLQGYDALLDRHAGSGLGPRELLSDVGDLLVRTGPLLSVLTGDPSVAAAGEDLHRHLHALADRTARALAGNEAAPEATLRAHCALGALFAGWDSAQRSGGAVPDATLQVVLDAALDALGSAEPAVSAPGR